MSKEKTPMAQPNQPPTNAPKPGGKTGKPRKQDTREPHVIFAARFNKEAKLMTRRFHNLSALGSAKRAAPTAKQVEQVGIWLREQTEACLNDLARKLRAMEAPASEEKPFAVLEDAPYVATKKPAATPEAAPKPPAKA